ncbi:MAG: hypothetical protein HZA84_09520 [Thaumarchaeota archaeon]|nr:hypothetical protein [Nitrososphaerota archaeon]
MLRLVALVMMSVLLSMTMISAISSGHFAEAKKASNDDVSNTLRHKYSKWVGNQVCGDELCSGHPYFKWNMKYRSYSSPYNTYDHQALLKLNKQK